FDITTSKLSDLWQIKSATNPPTEQDIVSALAHTGYNKISLDKNTLTKTDAEIDFGGVLKGFAADKVRNIATKAGIKSGIVNLGGNVCLIGSKNGEPWTVGIVNPFSPSDIYLTVEAENTNVITSGAYQRYFEFGGRIYHHILSPQSGYPAETDVASATVISADGTLADALSTAIFVQGSETGLKTARNLGVDAIIIKKDGSVAATENVKYKLND
ncbi:MAG: FAD:protein FMN transferase, partial [Monoglobales bacterium]